MVIAVSVAEGNVGLKVSSPAPGVADDWIVRVGYPALIVW